MRLRKRNITKNGALNKKYLNDLIHDLCLIAIASTKIIQIYVRPNVFAYETRRNYLQTCADVGTNIFFYFNDM